MSLFLLPMDKALGPSLWYVRTSSTDGLWMWFVSISHPYGVLLGHRRNEVEGVIRLRKQLEGVKIVCCWRHSIP
jgi:hypothetical protein